MRGLSKPSSRILFNQLPARTSSTSFPLDSALLIAPATCNNKPSSDGYQCGLVTGALGSYGYVNRGGKRWSRGEQFELLLLVIIDDLVRVHPTWSGFKLSCTEVRTLPTLCCVCWCYGCRCQSFYYIEKSLTVCFLVDKITNSLLPIATFNQ
jgi:hypothetical protein